MKQPRLQSRCRCRMAKALDPAEVADLTLVELSGEKLTSVLVPRIRLEISLSMAPVDEDPHRSRVSATARTFGVAEGAPEDDTTTPLYEGVVAYVLRFVDNGPAVPPPIRRPVRCQRSGSRRPQRPHTGALWCRPPERPRPPRTSARWH